MFCGCLRRFSWENLVFHQFTKVFSHKSFLLYGMYLRHLVQVYPTSKQQLPRWWQSILAITSLKRTPRYWFCSEKKTLETLFLCSKCSSFLISNLAHKMSTHAHVHVKAEGAGLLGCTCGGQWFLFICGTFLPIKACSLLGEFCSGGSTVLRGFCVCGYLVITSSQPWYMFTWWFHYLAVKYVLSVSQLNVFSGRELHVSFFTQACKHC